MRTRWLTRLLSKPLLDIGKSQEEAAAVAAAVAAEYAKGIDKKNPERTDVLLFLSNEEVAQMGEAFWNAGMIWSPMTKAGLPPQASW